MPEYALIIPWYAWLCLNVPKFVWMDFVLHSSIVIPYLKEPFFYCNWKYLILFFVFRLNICTSEILNLLLPLGTKGARGFEFYINSEKPSKYIYHAFLMIYLSILLLLLFSLFGTSEELIRDSQRLWFCSFVRL